MATDTLPTRTDLRKLVGKGAFTRLDFEQASEVSAQTARNRLAKLVEAGLVEDTGDTAKVLDSEGKPQRGRPRRVYRVTANPKRSTKAKAAKADEASDE